MGNNGESNDSGWKARYCEWECGLRKKQFSSSADDKQFFVDKEDIMNYKLYQAVRDGNEDAEDFVPELEQVLQQERLDWSTVFNQVTPTGDSMLHVAAEFGKVKVIEMIADRCPDLWKKTNKKGDTPLHVAARAKKIKAIKSLLFIYKHVVKPTSEKPENFIMSRNKYGNTALHEAVLSKHLVGVTFLLKAHSEERDWASYWTWNKTYNCKSPMYLAVLTGNEKILDYLLRIPFPSNQAVSNGDSSLHGVTSAQNPGENKISTSNGDNPLHAAILERNTGNVKILDPLLEISFPSDQAISNGDSPLPGAISEQNPDLHPNQKPDIQGKKNKMAISNGNSPLHGAISGQNTGVDLVGDKNKIFISNGDNPLYAAIFERNTELVQKIVDIKEELMHQRDEKNNTPLHHAAYANYVEGVRIMLEKSPMVAFQRNSDGNLPIHLASKKGHILVVEKLLELDWSNAALWLNNKGQNILHIAAMNGQNKMVKYLLKTKFHAENVNERDQQGDTPLHLASKKLHLLSMLLLSQNKKIDGSLMNNEGLTAKDIVQMHCKTPMTNSEYIAFVILTRAGVPLKASNELGVGRAASLNTEPKLKSEAKALALVAIMIATVTFAAIFTLPHDWKIIFISCDMIAMISSTISVILLTWVREGNGRLAQRIYRRAARFLYFALYHMILTFLVFIYASGTLQRVSVPWVGPIFMLVTVLAYRPMLPEKIWNVSIIDVRIMLFLFYGSNDTLISDQDGDVNQVDQS